MIPKNDLSGTRCFIDADGTLFDSLRHYNKVLDSIFLGKLTEHPYIDYYQDFGDRYDIIPGAPWRSILGNLYEYHTGERPNDFMVDLITETFEDRAAEMFSALEPEEFVIEPVIRFCHEYKEAGGQLIIHSGTNQKILEAMLFASHTEDLFDEYLCSDMLSDSLVLAVPANSNMVLNNLGEALPSGVRISTFNDPAYPTASNAVKQIFDAAHIPLTPLSEWCGKGAVLCNDQIEAFSLMVSSNVDAAVVLRSTIERSNGADIACCIDTDVKIPLPSDILGTWGYKTELLGRLLSEYPADEKRTFVIGDTKGDGFGAVSVGLPFLLVWRGYPKNPYCLKTGTGGVFEPDLVIDMRPERLSGEVATSNAIDNEECNARYINEIFNWVEDGCTHTCPKEQFLYQQLF